MLTKLLINNFIIIDKIEIDFSKNLNVIIGETGSGKSIIIEALMLLFGEKASPEFVRKDTNKAVIEASFYFDERWDILQKLNEIEIDCESTEIILRREIPTKGNSRCFINDTPVTLTVLKNFCENIVDFHGQNQQQQILEKENQLKIIDSLISRSPSLRGDSRDNPSAFTRDCHAEAARNDGNVISDYKNCYKEFLELLKNYNDFVAKKDFAEERSEQIAKIIDEIETVNPKINEDNILNNELKLLENSENLVSLSEQFLAIENSENETSTVSKLFDANRILNELLKIDSSFSLYSNEFSAAVISINETVKHINSYKNNIEFNPEKIEELRNRYFSIKKLMKKFGTIEEILQKKNELELELLQFENFDETIKKLKLQISEKQNELANFAKILSKKRKEIAKNIEEKIVKELENLGIENAILDIKFSTVELKTNFSDLNSEENNLIETPFISYENSFIKVKENGIDSVEFFISTNRGEPLTPISTTVSGGEISRIMLSLKTILANSDETPLLIFDEIDTGISGRIAQKVGLAMKNLANFHQVIAITHLPQIAAMGENIILIEKNIFDERVTTSAKILSDDEKTLEIAKMLSGENLTVAAVESAKELQQ